jgi:hypothetical protein
MEYANFIVLFATLVSIIWYCIETAKLRKINADILNDNRFNKILETRNNVIGKAKNVHGNNDIFKDFIEKLKQKVLEKRQGEFNLEEERKFIQEEFNNLIENDFNYLTNYLFLLTNMLNHLIKIKNDLPLYEYLSHYIYFISLGTKYEFSFIFYWGICIRNIGKDMDDNKLIMFLLFDEGIFDIRHHQFYKNTKLEKPN